MTSGQSQSFGSYSEQQCVISIGTIGISITMCCLCQLHPLHCNSNELCSWQQLFSTYQNKTRFFRFEIMMQFAVKCLLETLVNHSCMSHLNNLCSEKESLTNIHPKRKFHKYSLHVFLFYFIYFTQNTGNRYSNVLILMQT